MQFTGTVDKSVVADAYDIDAFESSAALVSKLHNLGRTSSAMSTPGRGRTGGPTRSSTRPR